MRIPPGCDPDSILLTFPVAREHAGLRLDRFVQSRIPRLSRTRAQKIVAACAYRPDGTLRRPSDRVRVGEVVLLVRPRFREPDVPMTFEVVFEDEHVLAIDKPAGLPMHPTASYHRHTLTWLLRERYGDAAPTIAHRLDRETSGLVVCGKGPDSARALKRAFERRSVDKTYLAIVEGRLPDEAGEVDLPLASVREGLHIMMEVRDAGPASRARTEYRVVARAAAHTLLELHPLTGRQHQLRVHMAAIGYPIVADKLYGPRGNAPFLEVIETGLTEELIARLGHHRQALHAQHLAVRHPRGDDHVLQLRAPLAEDLGALWVRLGGADIDSAGPAC